MSSIKKSMIPNISNLIPIYTSMYIRRFFRILIACTGKKPRNTYSKPVQNYFYYSTTKKTKHALLAYRLPVINEQIKSTWSSSDVHDIIRVLSDLGFKTDIIDTNDTTFVPRKKYDLFIGGTASHFKTLTQHLPKKCRKILYSGISYWKYNNDQENIRLKNLKEKNIFLHGERIVAAGDQDYALKHADSTILLSNETGKKTYPAQFQHKIYNLEVASFIHKKRINPKEKNFTHAKNNFLFLSGSGNVHKGLDLLLDAFVDLPRQNLYICTKLDADFKKVYNKELFDTKNIHYIGHIPIYGKKFYELAETCAFVILPSCSEGSPGSVADAMMQGLIPILSNTSHLDIKSIGTYISPCTSKEIYDIVNNISHTAHDTLEKQSITVQNAAIHRFDPKIFRKKIKHYIQTILETN